MAGFDFFAPQGVELGGILAGAQGILTGGQARGAGLAAEGQAMGQAYASIGHSVAQGIAQRAAEKKEQEVQGKIDEFLLKLDDGSLYEPRSFTYEEDISDPILQSIRSQEQFDIEGGIDPTIAAAKKHAAYQRSFMERYGNDAESAARKASELMKIRNDRVLSAQGRALMVQASRALVRQGVPDFLIRSLVDGKGAAGYVRDKDLADSRRESVTKLFTAQTPEEKQHEAVAQADQLARQKEERAERKRFEIERAISDMISAPLNVPTPVGTVPTGARVRPQAEASVGADLGVEETFVNRAESVGLPTKGMLRELREPIRYVPIDKTKMLQVRERLRAMGLEGEAIDRELSSRRIFTGPDDENLQKILRDRRREIEDSFLNDAPRFAGADAFSKADRDLFNSMDAAVASRLSAGQTAPFITLGQMASVDLDGLAAQLTSGTGNTVGKEDLEQVRIQLGGDGRPKVVAYGALSEDKRARIEAQLEQNVFVSDDVRDELILRQVLGPARNMTAAQSGKYMRFLRERHPDVVAEMARRAGAKDQIAPEPGPSEVPPASDGLTPAQRRLLGGGFLGAKVGEREVPTQASNMQDAARRATLPPPRDPERVAQDPIALQRREAFDQIRPEAEAAAAKLKQLGAEALTSGDRGRARRLLQGAATLRRAIELGDRGAVEKVLSELKTVLKAKAPAGRTPPTTPRSAHGG